MAHRRARERGSTLAALLLMIAVMSIMMTVAARQWSLVTRRELERELIYRGERIKAALADHQAQGQGVPTSLEDLTRPPRPSLPRVYPEPLTARYDRSGELVEGTGQWTVIRQGEGPPGTVSGAGRQQQQRRRRGRESRGPQIVGIEGVRSPSDEESLGGWDRYPPGTPYSEWRFQLQGLGITTNQPTGQPINTDLRPPGFGGLRAPGGPPVRPATGQGVGPGGAPRPPRPGGR